MLHDTKHLTFHTLPPVSLTFHTLLTEVPLGSCEHTQVER